MSGTSGDDRGWGGVATVAGWQTAASLCYYTVFAATAFFRDAFALTASLVGLVLTAAMLGYTLALFPSGAAVDGLGEGRVMVGSLAGLAAAVVGLSFAPSYGVLLGGAAVLGAAYAASVPGANRAVVATAPADRRGLAMGLKQVGITAGSGAASLLVTGVAAVAAWQTGFRAIALLAGAYALVFAARYDGTTGSGEFALPDLSGLRADRAYLVLVGAGLFLGAVVFSMLGYTVLYVRDAVGASAATGGVVLAVTQVTGSVGRVGAGNIADRLGGARGAATVALGQTALAGGLFALIAGGDWSVGAAVALFAGLGVTVHATTGVYYACLTELVALDDVGGATAVGQTAINVGGMVAPPLFGLLVDAGGYGYGWGLLGALTLGAAGLLAVVRARTRGR
ncbi:MAG: MFS transporter [Haloferacaceae archaeon]